MKIIVEMSGGDCLIETTGEDCFWYNEKDKADLDDEEKDKADLDDEDE